MGRVLRIINGVSRSVDEASTTPIYNVTSTIGTLLTSGSPLTLPSSGSYTVVSGVTSLLVFVNMAKQIYSADFNVSGASPYTAVTFTYDLQVGDIVEFAQYRAT